MVHEGFDYSKGDKTYRDSSGDVQGEKDVQCTMFSVLRDHLGDFILLKNVGVHNYGVPGLGRNYIISSAKQKASETLLEPPAKLVRSE